jgi:hypothetical protein
MPELRNKKNQRTQNKDSPRSKSQKKGSHEKSPQRKGSSEGESNSNWPCRECGAKCFPNKAKCYKCGTPRQKGKNRDGDRKEKKGDHSPRSSKQKDSNRSHHTSSSCDWDDDYVRPSVNHYDNMSSMTYHDDDDDISQYAIYLTDNFNIDDVEIPISDAESSCAESGGDRSGPSDDESVSEAEEAVEEAVEADIAVRISNFKYIQQYLELFGFDDSVYGLIGLYITSATNDNRDQIMNQIQGLFPKGLSDKERGGFNGAIERVCVLRNIKDRNQLTQTKNSLTTMITDMWNKKDSSLQFIQVLPMIVFHNAIVTALKV